MIAENNSINTLTHWIITIYNFRDYIRVYKCNAIENGNGAFLAAFIRWTHSSNASTYHRRSRLSHLISYLKVAPMYVAITCKRRSDISHLKFYTRELLQRNAEFSWHEASKREERQGTNANQEWTRGSNIARENEQTAHAHASRKYHSSERKSMCATQRLEIINHKNSHCRNHNNGPHSIDRIICITIVQE